VENIRLTVLVDGGMVQAAYVDNSNVTVEIVVVDYDTEGSRTPIYVDDTGCEYVGDAIVPYLAKPFVDDVFKNVMGDSVAED
jgi:hypothetical protein